MVCGSLNNKKYSIDPAPSWANLWLSQLRKTLSAIGFTNETIGWFKSYLSNQFFGINLENFY